MEQKIAPTSPKKAPRTGGKNDEKRMSKRSIPIGSSLFFFIISLLGGFLAVVLVLTQANELGISFLGLQQPRIIIRNGAEEFAKQEEFRLAFVDEVESTFLSIYKSKTSVESPDTLSEALLKPEDFVGFGFFLTSDGTGISTNSVLTSESDSYIGVTNRGEFQKISNVVVDSVSGLSFFSFPGSGFQVIDISDSGEDLPLTPVILLEKNVPSGSYTFSEHAIRHNQVSTLHQTSEEFFVDAEIPSPSSFFSGTPVYKGDGTMLGLYTEGTTITLLPNRSEVISLYLENKNITYPYFGVFGYDLSDVTYAPAELRQNRSEGFLLATSDDKTIPAISKNSPSTKVLKEGDVLIRINNIPITDTTNLQDLLLKSRAEDAVEVSFVRDAIEQEVSITLGSL